MIRYLATFTCLACTLAGLACADEKTLKEMEGTYKLAYAEKDGKAAEKGLIDTFVVTIKDDVFTVMPSEDEKHVAKIKITLNDKLSTIDILPQDGREKGKTFPGIFRMEKGDLIIAYSEKGVRPTEFKSENEAVLLRLKKVEK